MLQCYQHSNSFIIQNSRDSFPDTFSNLAVKFLENSASCSSQFSDTFDKDFQHCPQKGFTGCLGQISDSSCEPITNRNAVSNSPLNFRRSNQSHPASASSGHVDFPGVNAYTILNWTCTYSGKKSFQCTPFLRELNT